MSADRWIEGRAALRAADPRMAALVNARPLLDPDAFFDTWPSELWSALVSQVIGKAVARVWELDKPSIADVDAFGERFRPWRTLAAVYLLTRV